MRQTIRQEAVRNALLRHLCAEDFDKVSTLMEAVELPRLHMVVEAGMPAEYAYFPEDGIGSIVVRSPEGQSVEIGMFGRDGVAPPALIVGTGQSPMEIFMQVGGHGYRIGVPALAAAMSESASLRTMLTQYAHVLSVQTAFTALSNAVHPVDVRLARWLLMCHDRIDGDEMPLTHDFISVMLSVRRPSVTNALHVLEGKYLIQSERGYVTIRDRKGLEDFAADAYGKPEAEYHRLIGKLA